MKVGDHIIWNDGDVGLITAFNPDHNIVMIQWFKEGLGAGPFDVDIIEHKVARIATGAEVIEAKFGDGKVKIKNWIF